MKLIVCGGRDFTDQDYAFAILDQCHHEVGITCLVEGGARGADRLGRLWAISRGVRYLTFAADWDRHGKSAGFLRNAEMLNSGAEGVIAFPGGRGTAHMIRISKERSVPVVEVPLRTS